MIPVYKFSEVERAGFEDYLKKQVIKGPTKNLRNIYERRILYEISYLRAEKYDSPENAEELKEFMQNNKSKEPPRGIQNKNFDTLLKYHSKLLESPSQKPPYPALSMTDAVNLLRELNQYLCGFYKYVKTVPPPKVWGFEPKILEPLPDPRCVQHDPNMFFCYLLTRFRENLYEREMETFNKLTNKEFDQESATNALKQMREVLSESDLHNFKEYIQQISNLSWTPDKSENQYKKLPEECESISDFYGYLFETNYSK